MVIDNQQPVCTRSRLDIDSLYLGDCRHVKTGQGPLGEGACVRVNLACVIHIKDVARPHDVGDGYCVAVISVIVVQGNCPAFAGHRSTQKRDIERHRTPGWVDMGIAHCTVGSKFGDAEGRLEQYAVEVLDRQDRTVGCRHVPAIHSLPAGVDLVGQHLGNLSQHVGDITASIDSQQAVDRIDQVVGVPDIDGISTFLGTNAGVARQDLDVDLVVAGTTVQVGNTPMGGFDGEDIVARTQLDVQRLQAVISDAARQLATGDDRVASHPKPGQAVLGQGTNVIGRAVAVEHVHHVDLLGLVDPDIRVHRSVEVAVAFLRPLDPFALKHGDGADRRDLHCCGEIVAGTVDDNQKSIICGGDKGTGRTLIDGLCQRLANLGSSLPGLHYAADSGARFAVIEDHGPDLTGDRNAV